MSYRAENHLGWERYNVETAEEMIAHLEAHRAAGDIVPQDTFDELRRDYGVSEEQKK